MNERIKELAEQANITIVPESFDDASRSWNETMEKFAELIVRECAELIDAEEIQSSYGDYLKQHFGVEE
jgi:hypothetical protein